jgi:hypothetical protein
MVGLNLSICAEGRAHCLSHNLVNCKLCRSETLGVVGNGRETNPKNDMCAGYIVDDGME